MTGHGRSLKLISWNLLRLVGASLDDVVALIEREAPDVMLMQEATQEIDLLQSRVGGFYSRTPLPGRIHGLATWLRHERPAHPVVMPLPSGSIVNRICQITDLGEFTVVNVHLSHGQILNRRQLRRISGLVPHCAAVIGDYNLVGPVLLPGFRDVGPRRPTHRMSDLVPLRLDRCVVRGVHCTDATVLPRGTSDHRPIMMRLAALEGASEVGKQKPHRRIA